MNKKLISMVVGGVITVGSLGYNISTTMENRELNSNLKSKETQILEKDKIINDLKEEKELLQQEKEFIKKTNEELLQEKEELENRLKEVLPTSLENVHFNPNNLTEKSNANVARLNELLKGTGLQGLGSSYKQAEEYYGVNAIFLISLTAEESGWGRSRRALEDNNLSGFEVYNDSAQGARFNSKHDSIMITGKLLGNSYLKSDGKYYKGKDIYSVNKTYCPVNGYSWSNNIINIANKLLER